MSACADRGGCQPFRFIAALKYVAAAITPLCHLRWHLPLMGGEGSKWWVTWLEPRLRYRV